MKPKIIFADEEEIVLKTLERDLFQADIDAEYFTSADEVLDHLSQHKVDIIVSGLNLSGMDGIALLTEVLKSYPDTYRVLLSSTEIDNLSFKEALQDRTIEQCFAKPWDVNELLTYFERFKSYAQYSVV